MNRASLLRPTGFTLLELMVTVAIVAILASLAFTAYENHVNRVRIAQAVTDIKGLEVSISHFYLDNRRLPDDLAEIGKNGLRDPWGNPYRYLNFATVKGKGSLRKDKNLVPINSDYDLYSAGPDGTSQPPLTAKSSKDDIIRANDGAYVGEASKY
jgi:general secretion pathway protein G